LDRNVSNKAAGSSARPNDTPVVYVVDDDISVREALEALIQAAGWRPSAFSSADQFLAHPHALGPSCLILDVMLPDLVGLELQQQIANERADMPIIFITAHGDVPMMVRAMKAGAAEFLTKPFGDEALLDAIRNALTHSTTALGIAADLQALQSRYAALSGREREVMALVVSGLMNKQVGGKLGISEITVKAHRGRVMRKMQVRSLADLVTAAARLGIPR
jgi:FixJ family two-component response regulator